MSTHQHPRQRQWALRPHLFSGTLVAVVFCSIICSSIGCSRAYYRQQADEEANCIIDNKSLAAGSEPGQFRMDIDPRSRMYDADDPDCPPMPPDDPVSHQLMHCVDCKPGSPCWRHMETTAYTDNPGWQEHLPRDEEGNVVLDLTGAVQLALLESPNYQQQLETLYLSGLDVTFERFRFDTQFFGGSSIFYTAAGPGRTGTPSGSSQLEIQPFGARGPAGRSRIQGNSLRAQKLTATGGDLLVGFANSLMWEFAGPDGFTSTTALNFSLIQPLLRAGGRIRVMERLTIAERALLANVRQMEHYRRGFYLSVVTGNDPGEGPNRRGGFFGGSGLEGFTGVGGGGFGRVGEFGGGFGGQGFGFTGGAGAQQAGGYLGLLQTAQVIRNQYSNIAALGDSVEQLQAAYEAGRIDRFQVDLARQALYNAQSQLLNSETIYESTLDVFKLQHGLPPELPVKISDPMMDRFNLLDPDLAAVQIRVTDLLTVLRGSGEGAEEGRAGEPLILPTEPPPEAKMKTAPTDFASLVRQAAEVKAASQQRLAAAQNDLQLLNEALPERRSSLERLAQRDDAREIELDPDLLSGERLDERVTALTQEVETLSRRMETVWTRLDELTGEVAIAPAEHRVQLTSALTQLSGELLELSLLQARARLDAITFQPVDLTAEEAFCIASRHRRDWMNARAALVDSWRLIHFNANDLESDLDLVFEGDIETESPNPFDLRGRDGRLSVGLQFDAPLTRLSERNTYRQSLIEYQQSRRRYYQFRDRVQRDVRQTLRQLQLDDLNFELRRAAVHVGITQVDLARFRLSEPARPVAPTAPGQPLQPGGQAQFGATVARDLVTALVDLLNVQNDFLSVWVDQEVQRLNLDFDLGIMELDTAGIRIEHEQPLRTFLAAPTCSTACELPAPCADVEPVVEELPMAGEEGPELLPEPLPTTGT
jgi:Outer membrane efflux protein